ncbi:MAG: hypothetical protein KatS3mg004_0183 [Bryobacteraceae bacterium]|nr:MAG: hypothetical protein KatS3mg004_0183 [Bryobacteraceae bacterium]
MSKDEITLAEALSLLWEREVQNAPDRHPAQTDACLPLPRFAPWAIEGWTDAERAHVAGCTSYCQRMLGLFWREDHPPIEDLVDYATGRYPYRAAMEFHLEHDGCLRCGLLVRVLASLGQLLGEVRGLAVAYSQGVAAPVVTEAATFAKLRKPFYLRQASEDGQLIVTLVETDPPEHELKVHVEAPRVTEPGCRARVTLAGETATLEQELALQKTEYGWEASSSFGKFEEAAARLGADWVLVAALI